LTVNIHLNFYIVAQYWHILSLVSFKRFKVKNLSIILHENNDLLY